MNVKLENVANVILALRWGILLLGAVLIFVLDLPGAGLAVVVLGLLFSVAMRFKAFRFWIVGTLTGLGTQVIKQSFGEGRVASVVPATAPVQNKPAAETLDPATLAALIERARSSAVLLKRHWPPSTPAPQNSWLGGLPALPDGVEWPHNPDTGFALHHLAQIDLSEMPDLGEAQVLPRTGMMWFFADIDEEMCWEPEAGHGSSRIVYHDKSTKGVTPRAAPATLPQVDHPLDSLEAQSSYRGPRPRVYPRWPVSGHISSVWDVDDMPDGVSYSSGYYEAATAAQKAARQEIVGEGVVTDHTARGPFSEVKTDLGDGRVRHTVVYKPEGPDGMFPYCGAFAQIFARTFDDKVQSQITSTARLTKKPENGHTEGSERLMKLEDAGVASRELVTQLDAVAQDAPLPKQAQAAFDRVMAEHVAANLFGVYPEKVLRAAVVEMVQGGFDRPDLLAMVPEALITMVHDDVLPSHSYAYHYLMSVRTSGSNPTPGEGVRLAQFDSDYGLGMMFCDVGIIDFWISPQDLAAGRWDQAWAATAGG